MPWRRAAISTIEPTPSLLPSLLPPLHTFAQPNNDKDGCICVGPDSVFSNPNPKCDALSPDGASPFCWGTVRCDGQGTCKETGK